MVPTEFGGTRGLGRQAGAQSDQLAEVDAIMRGVDAAGGAKESCGSTGVACRSRYLQAAR
jgi:hypothetical protein